MPFIQCHIATGLSEARKRQLIRDIVTVTQEAIDSDPKIINVVLHEHPTTNLSVSGRIDGETENACMGADASAPTTPRRK